jgi:hypothetical protein
LIIAKRPRRYDLTIAMGYAVVRKNLLAGSPMHPPMTETTSTKLQMCPEKRGACLSLSLSHLGSGHFTPDDSSYLLVGLLPGKISKFATVHPFHGNL